MHTFLKLLFVLVSAISYSGAVYAQEKGYTLTPSEETITTHVNTSDTGYGINVKLLKNGELVKNQSNVTFNWNVADTTVISISPWAGTSGCTFDLVPPCPNNTADLKGLKVGKSSIYVVAYVDGVKSAATTILVEVKDVWDLALIEQNGTLQVGETVDYKVRLKKKDSPNYKPGSEVNYVWQEVAKPGAPYYISMASPVCTLTSCSFESYKITGLRPGRAKVQVIAMSDNVPLDRIEFEIDVVGNEEILEDTEVPVAVEDELLEYNPIDIYEDPMNQDYSVLKAELDEQKKLIEEQQRRLNDQNIRIQKTESVLQRILRMLRGLFN